MQTNIVRLIALLIAGLCAFAAYTTQDPMFLIPSLFFALMVFLSVRNAGSIESPFVYLAVALVSFFYSFMGLASGAFTWKNHTVTIQQDPQLFWAAFFVTSIFGVGLLIYARSQSHNERGRKGSE